MYLTLKEMIYLLICIWFGIGFIAELIGTLYFGFNGIRNCAIIIALGPISLIGIAFDIDDD